MKPFKLRFWIVMVVLALQGYPAQSQQVAKAAWFELVSSGQVEKVRALIGSGQMNVANVVDDQKNTPLHLAAERCNLGMVKMLLSARADPLLKNVWNDTPLRIAAVRCGQTAPVTQLIATAAQGGPASTPAPAAPMAKNQPAGAAPLSGPSAAGPNLVGVQALSAAAGGSRNSCFAVSWQLVTPEAWRRADRTQSYRGLLGEGQNFQGTQMLVGTNKCSAQILAMAASCNDILTDRNERLGFDVVLNSDLLNPGESMILGFKYSQINRLSEYDVGVPFDKHNFVVGVYSAADANWLKTHPAFANNRKILERRLNVVRTGSANDFTIVNWSSVILPNPHMAHLQGLDLRSCTQTQFLENWPG